MSNEKLPGVVRSRVSVTDLSDSGRRIGKGKRMQDSGKPCEGHIRWLAIPVQWSGRATMEGKGEAFPAGKARV